MPLICLKNIVIGYFVSYFIRKNILKTVFCIDSIGTHINCYNDYLIKKIKVSRTRVSSKIPYGVSGKQFRLNIWCLFFAYTSEISGKCLVYFSRYLAKRLILKMNAILDHIVYINIFDTINLYKNLLYQLSLTYEKLLFIQCIAKV